MNRFCPGSSGKAPMSPGVEGARLTIPPPRSAVKVLMKKDSPPSIRRIPRNSPAAGRASLHLHAVLGNHRPRFRLDAFARFQVNGQ